MRFNKISCVINYRIRVYNCPTGTAVYVEIITFP